MKHEYIKWTFPNKTVQVTDYIDIYEEGIYSVQVIDGGCVSNTEFKGYFLHLCRK